MSFQGLSSGITLMQIQSGRTVPLMYYLSVNVRVYNCNVRGASTYLFQAMYECPVDLRRVLFWKDFFVGYDHKNLFFMTFMTLI